MEIKKGKVNVFIGPTGSKKIECLKKYNKNIKENIFNDENLNKKICEILDIKKSKVIKALEMVGLSTLDANKKLKDLTTNELKRIDIAHEISSKKDNYIFLHPEVGLDDKNRDNLIIIFRMLKNRYKKTIIIVSSDSDWVHEFADFLFVVYNGNVIYCGTTYDVFCNEEICKTYKINIPQIIKFEKLVLEKKSKRIGFRNEINDLIKDIYRNI